MVRSPTSHTPLCSVLFECALCTTRHAGVWFLVQLYEGARIIALGNVLARIDPDLVQGSRRIVRAEIATVAPDRAVVHQAVFEEHFLAVADVLASEQDLPRVIADLRRDRRRIVIGKPGDADRKSVGWAKRVSVRLALGGRRRSKKKQNNK